MSGLGIFKVPLCRKSHEKMQSHVLAHLPEGLADVLLDVAVAGLVSSIRGRSITGCPNLKTELMLLLTTMIRMILFES